MNAHKIIRIVLLGALLCMAMPLQAQSPDKEPPHPTYHMCCAGHIGCPGHPEPNNVIDYPQTPDRSKMMRIYMHESESYNFDLTVLPFTPGVDTSATWTLIAKDREQKAKAVITFEDMAGNDTTITIIHDYTYDPLVIVPDNIDFGKVLLGQRIVKKATLYNTNKTNWVQQIYLNFDDYNEKGYFHFSLDSIYHNYQINWFPPGDSIPVYITFTARELTEKPIVDSVLGRTHCDFGKKAIARATVVAPLISVSDTVVKTRPGKPVAGEFVIKNNGSYPLIITKVDGIGYGIFDYTYYQDINPSPKNPIIIGTAPFNSRSFYFVFSPRKAGIYRDYISFASNSQPLWQYNDDYKLYNAIDSTAYITGICEGPDDVDEEAEHRFECYLQNNSELIITTDLPADEPFNIEIYSYLGTKVLQCERKDRIDISTLPAGLYFVRCGTKFSKFVKI